MTTRTKSRTYGTEYSDNFDWTDEQKRVSTRNKDTSGLFQGDREQPNQTNVSGQHEECGLTTNFTATSMPLNTSVFPSTKYPSLFRETVIRKDERGHYIDPFKNIANKPYGRRLMYDDTHPDKMYGSMWSSELADMPACYSFPTTTEFDPEMPWTKDMSWQYDGETGKWPTDQWKHWTNVALCPPYDGHSDQPQYSQYKVQVP